MLAAIRILHNFIEYTTKPKGVANTGPKLNKCTLSCCVKVPIKPNCCYICTEPLAIEAEYVCIRCKCVWCDECSRYIHKCIWCAKICIEPSAPTATYNFTTTEPMVPCTNYRRGCDECFLQSKKDEKMYHERKCKYNTITCPLSRDCGGLTTREIFKHITLRHGVKASKSRRVNIISIQNLQSLVKNESDILTYRRVFIHDLNFFKFIFTVTKFDISVDIAVQPFNGATNIYKTNRSYRTYVEFKTETDSNKFPFIVAQNKKNSTKWKYESNVTEYIEIYISIGLYYGNHMALNDYLKNFYYNEIPRPFSVISSMVDFEIANDFIS